MNRVMNTFKDFEYNNKENEYSGEQVKNAQQSLKKIVGSDNYIKSQSIKELYNCALKGEASGAGAISGMNDKIQEWGKFSWKATGEFLTMRQRILNFIEEISEDENYVKSFLFKEEDEIFSLWVILKNVTHDERMKYIKLTRENLNFQREEVDIMIYEENEINEVVDELNDLSVEVEEF